MRRADREPTDPIRNQLKPASRCRAEIGIAHRRGVRRTLDTIHAAPNAPASSQSPPSATTTVRSNASPSASSSGPLTSSDAVAAPCHAGILIRRIEGNSVISVATIVSVTHPNTLIVMCAWISAM